MKMKRMVCFVLSLMMLSCIFAVYIEKAFAIDNSAVMEKILASDGSVNDYFGGLVAISGNKVVVGAHNDDDKGNDSGSAYVYDLSSGTGSLSDVLASEIKLTASDSTANDFFGGSVSISGDKVVVGAYGNSDRGFCSGSAYVYDLSNGTGSLSDVLASELKLIASDGARDEFFGDEVAISGAKVVVGAYGDGDNGYYSGSAYVYDLSNGTGSLSDVLTSELKLTASDGAIGDLFGDEVAISGDKVVVGANCDDDNGSNSGSAYVYDLSSGTGSLSDVLTSELKLTVSDGAADDRFGGAVAIFGDKVIVGASSDDDKGSNSGSVYTHNGKYNITLDAQGGTGGDNRIIVTYLAPMPTANAPFRAGYTFDGYYTEINGGGTKYYNSDMTTEKDWSSIGGDIFYANWIVNTYLVSFNGNENDGGSMTDQSFVYDTAQRLTVNGYTKTGYTFTDWAASVYGAVAYADEESVNNLTDVNSDTVTLYAKWTANPFTVTLNQQGGTGAKQRYKC